MGVRASVLGASGYSGGELLRLLAGHPAVDVVALGAERAEGDAAPELHPHLTGLVGERFVSTSEAAGTEADVCFSCMPSGALAPHLAEAAAGLVVDLAGDFRLDPDWLYGLTEFARESLAGAARVAVPGCYPTATLLAVVPFVRAGVVAPPLIVDALSGTSGAGRSGADHLSLASASGDVTAYGSVTHRHVAEIERYVEVFGGEPLTVSFTPHLVPMARGLLVTARARLAEDLDDADAHGILTEAYADEPFVEVVPGWPGTKAVAGSNRALVSARVDARAGFLICSAAIDNLGKGAAGQALQNANIALGLDEAAGLGAIGVWP